MLIMWVIDRFKHRRAMDDLDLPRSYVLCGASSGWTQLRNGGHNRQLRMQMLHVG